jgi:hypothetical protein
MPRTHKGLAPVFGLVAVALVLPGAVRTAEFNAERYLSHIKFLASPEMRGRESGSPELEKAAQYIAGQFRSDGLKPLAGKSYLQAFEVTTSAKLGKANRLDFMEKPGAEPHLLQLSREFIPFNFSSHGKASGTVVFAGYGITAPEYNYDDYAGIDVRGKFVIVLAHEPQEYNEKSVFDGKIYTDHAQYYSKAANARRHGAAGVILISDRINHKTSADDLEAFGNAAGPTDAGILIVQVKEEVVAPWFKAAGKDLMELERGIDSDTKPRSFALKGVEVR